MSMKISNSELPSSNIKLSNNNKSRQMTVEPAKKINTNDEGNLAGIQGNKEWSQANIKNISQINEYDKDNMPVSERVVIEAIQKANKAIMGGNRRFEFSIHEATNEIVVKVFNSETDELIREIPNEKILDMVAKICEMAGIFVDERR